MKARIEKYICTGKIVPSILFCAKTQAQIRQIEKGGMNE